MIKGEKMPEAQKEKIRKARKGKKHTMETKLLISRKNKGKTAWNKGLSNPNATKNLGDYAKKGKTVGEKGANWKGGIVFVKGYYYVYNEELGRHFGGKYIKRANLVWYKEKGEIINPPFFLHHLNNDRTDDRIENLLKINLSVHSKIHFEELGRDGKGRVLKK